MLKREISGSGRIKASIFVDGRSMMKDRSKSNTGSRLVLEIKWIAFLAISGGTLRSTDFRRVYACWNRSMSIVLQGFGFSSSVSSDTACIRSGWFNPIWFIFSILSWSHPGERSSYVQLGLSKSRVTAHQYWIWVGVSWNDGGVELRWKRLL